MTAPDLVNHPPHYTAGGIECIDAIHAALGDEGFLAYCRGNALKYVWRAPLKASAQRRWRCAMPDLIKCHTCAAWDAFSGGENGLCRRYAPRPVMFGLFVDGDGRYGEVTASFPHTREDDGCCEGVPR